MKPQSTFLWGLMLFFSLLALPALSQEQEQKQKQKKIYNRAHCKLYLKDGRVIDSYLFSNAWNTISYTDSLVKLSDKPNAFSPKVQKYYNADIDSLVEWNDRNPGFKFRNVPVKVRHSYTADSVTVDSLRYPSMATLMYKGKNVEGYMVWDNWNGFRYLYKTKDMDAAHAYIGQKHRLTDQRKEVMAEEFKKYPRFVNFVNSLKSNAFKDAPALLLYELDKIIEEDKRQ